MSDRAAPPRAHRVVAELDLSDERVDLEDVSEPARREERVVSLPVREEHNLEEDRGAADDVSHPSRILPVMRLTEPPLIAVEPGDDPED